MRQYNVPNSENLIGGSVTGLYANYPYNDLRPDIYFWDKPEPAIPPRILPLNRTDGCDNLAESIEEYAPLGTPNSGTVGYSKKVFTFASPDLMFTKPFKCL